MLNINEVIETNKMIHEMNLDVRTITMGISLLDCIDSDLDRLNEKIYNKIYEAAKDLVKTGEEISRELGMPSGNKRISVTPIALIGGAACHTIEDFASIAKTLDKVAHEVGVNFLGGYSALVSTGMTPADELLIRSIPLALSTTERVCSSVNLGSTKTGINMDAVKLMGEMVRETAEYTKEDDSLGCAKLVVFCNAPDDNPFMAGAFHGVTEADKIINVGVSGPGVVKTALEKVLNDRVIDLLADKLLEYQSKENTRLPVLQAELKEVKRRIDNLVAAIEQGILTPSTKSRMEELEQQREALETSILQEQIETPPITREQILFWFDQFRHGDPADIAFQEKVIDCFVNSIYLFDDRIVVNFNYQEGGRPVSLEEVLSSFLDGNGAPKKALRKRKAFFIMIAALCECFHLPLTSDRVSGSFCFVGEMQELLL